MKCTCKKDHWNNFFKNKIYYYEEDQLYKTTFIIVNNSNRINHSFSTETFNEHFITEKEYRKLKLNKLNKLNEIQ